MSLSKNNWKRHLTHLVGTFLLFLYLISFCSTCVAITPLQDIYKSAYIEDNGTNWLIKHEILYGRIETDLLTNNVWSIELFFFNGDDGKSFRIRAEFKEVNSNMMFSPSNVTVKLSNGEILKARGLGCPYIEPDDDPKKVQIQSKIEYLIPTSKGACYYLFFDHPAPPIEEEIVMYLNDSLTSNGNKVNIPPLYFRKTTKNINRWGFFQ